MSLPTQPDLIAKLTSGEISGAEYREEFARRAREHEAAYAISYLEGVTGVSPTLVASEIALQRESLIRQQERAARAVAERQREEAEAQAVRQAQAQADADRRARDAAAADKAAQQRLAAQRAAVATQQTARLQAEQARQRAEQQRVNELIEAARQRMIAEQGRVVAAEQYGRVVAEASAQARAEQAYLAGEIAEPPEMYVPVYESYEELPVGYTPPGGAYQPEYIPTYEPYTLPEFPVYTPPEYIPTYEPYTLPEFPVYTPPAAPPTQYIPTYVPYEPPGGYAPPAVPWPAGWAEMAAAPIPGVSPYIVAEPAAKQVLALSTTATWLLIAGGIVLFMLLRR